MNVITASVTLLAISTLSAAAMTPRQAAMQSAISGWGTSGELAIVDTPNNGGPYSLKIHWRSNPDANDQFWVNSWAAPAKGYDTLSLDLMVAENNGKAGVAIYLSETDGDRWLTGIDAKKLQPGIWHHFEIKKSDFAMYRLGDKEDNWDIINKITVEPGGKDGEITFYLDNIFMSGPAGKKDLLDPDNLPRLYTDIPEDHKPLNGTNPAGFAFLTGSMNFWENRLHPTNLDDICKLSPSIAIASCGFDGYDRAGKLSERLVKLGRPLLEEHQDGHDFAVEMTEKQAWCTRWDGESNNITPNKFDTGHSACHCNADFINMNKRRADAIMASGINTLCLVDYVWPYFGGRWGYCKSDIKAYRKALNGTDGGLKLIEGKRTRIATFWDYFADYSGFKFKPGDLGYKSWDEYTPTTEQEVIKGGETARRNMFVFITLNHYEWLKFLQDIGLYMKSKGGNLWIIPNPEDLGDAADYIYAARMEGLQCNLPEYFGNPEWTDALYRSGRYLAKNVRESGNLAGPCFETGVCGHGKPYYDSQVSYAMAYDVCTALETNIIKNDFLDEAPINQIDNTANAAQFDRFRDTMSKVYAFDQYKADKPKKSESKVAVVTSRNINRYRGDIFYGFAARKDQWDGCAAEALASEGLSFDLMDPIRYAPLEDYKAIFWGVTEVPPACVERIRKWLVADPSHVLICHSSQPTRRNGGLMFNLHWFPEQRSIGDPNGGKPWGLPKITQITAPKDAVIDRISKPFEGVFSIGEPITLPNDLYEAKGGKVLLSASGHPLVSEFWLPSGGRTVYLHYRSGEPETLALDRKVAAALAEYLGAKKVANSVDDVMVHSYGMKDGGTAHVLWAKKTLDDWSFVYDMNRKQRLLYTNPGFNAAVKVPVSKPGKYIVYDMLTGKTNRVKAKDTLELTMSDVTCGVYYVFPDNKSGEAKLEKLKASPVHELLAK
ncbi:MAG: hypothetical protein ABFD64_09490 [Armatimonadota bacterium]